MTASRRGPSRASHFTVDGRRFFVVPTATCRLLFVLVILAHERRRIGHTAVTAHPTAAWTAQQLTDTSCRRTGSAPHRGMTAKDGINSADRFSPYLRAL